MSREAADLNPVAAARSEMRPLAERPASGAPPVFRTEDLFSGASEIRLTHAGAEYRLKITRAGKLILNK
ncbi:MAG TPA: hemin uptake protein HemP [Mesorhizobium sp.]|jgi:hemin uptake protein HemP|nr:hemin uptake protein HemP [Mesorhizobium sp.]